MKKKRRISNENGERTSRLRFSDVNEYNSIEEVKIFIVLSISYVRNVSPESILSSHTVDSNIRPLVLEAFVNLGKRKSNLEVKNGNI